MVCSDADNGWSRCKSFTKKHWMKENDTTTLRLNDFGLIYLPWTFNYLDGKIFSYHHFISL
jgi:hypothetical protein